MMRMNVRMTVRVALAAVVVGIGLQADVANAGFRHFRSRGSCCMTGGCSAPALVAAPAPVCACGASGFQSTMAQDPFQLAYGGQPAYGGLPMTASGTAYGPGLNGDSFAAIDVIGNPLGSPAGSPPAIGGPPPGNGSIGTLPVNPQVSGFGGYSGFSGPGLQYGPATQYGSGSQYGLGYQNGLGSQYGPGLQYGFGSVMPSLYAPVPFQYTPVPPTPAFDLVW
jgi:hypothetical protein